MDMQNEANDASRSEVEVGEVSGEALAKQLQAVSIGNQECEQSKLTLPDSLIVDFSLSSESSVMGTSESSCGPHTNGEVFMNGVNQDGACGSPTVTSSTPVGETQDIDKGGVEGDQDRSDEEANFEVSELINEILHQSSYLDEGSLNGLEFVESLPDGLDGGDVDLALTSTSHTLPLYLDHPEGRSSSPDSDSNMRTASEGSSTPTSQLSAPSTHSSDHQNYCSFENRGITSQTNIIQLSPNSENKPEVMLSKYIESKSEELEVSRTLDCTENLGSVRTVGDNVESEVVGNSNISEVSLLEEVAASQNTVENVCSGTTTSVDKVPQSMGYVLEMKSNEDENDTQCEVDVCSVESIVDITSTADSIENEKVMANTLGEVCSLETIVNAAVVNGVVSQSPDHASEAASDSKSSENIGDICETAAALETLSLNTRELESPPENSNSENVPSPDVNSLNCQSELKKLELETDIIEKSESPCQERLEGSNVSDEPVHVEEGQHAVPEKGMESIAQANDCLCKRMQTVDEGGGVMVGVWAELRSSLRQLHRSMIPQTTQGSVHRSRPSLNRIKALANMLVTHDAHQLYLRISHLAHELCIELKVRLLATIHDNPTTEEATAFIQGVCDSYQWVMSVCEALHPALERLDSEHLSRFKLNWVTVNMHIFHSTILTDPDVQDYAQICKLKLSGSPGGDDVMGCLASLHRTLAVAEAVWVRADALLQDYAVERAALSTRRRQLLADWEQFKAQQRTQHQQEHVLKNGLQSTTVTSTAEDAQCPCDDCAGGRGNLGDSQTSSTNPRIPLSSTADIRPPSSCECHFCNASMAAATPEEPVLPPSSGSSLPPLAQPQLSLYPHIHSTPPGSDIVGVGQSREELGPIPPAPTTKPPITTNPYVGSDLLTEQLMREWELVYGDTLTPPGSHPILPPPEAVLPRYEGDPSSLVSGVETLRISSSRPSYTRTMVDPSLPYVPDSHATARAHTTILPSSHPPSSTANHPVSSVSHHAPKVPLSSRSNAPCSDGGCPSTPEVSSGAGTKCCSVTNTTSVITHTRAHHTHTTASAQKGKCLNGLEETRKHQVECADRSTSRESVGESETSGGDEWSSGDESDSSTTVSSTHQDPHCDCCYCHMLHHKQGGGRQKYSDRRDRLLQILSRKKKARSCSTVSCSSSSVTTNSTSQSSATLSTPTTSAVPATKGSSTPLGGQNIDKILDYIEGNHTDEAKHAKKAAKKARQKQKKMAIRREEEEEDEDFEEKEDDCEEDEEVEEDGPLAELRRRAPDVTITVVRPGQQTSRTPTSPQMTSQRPREPSPSSMDVCKPPPAKLVPSLVQASAESVSQSHPASRTILHPYRQSNQQGRQLSQSSAPTPQVAANGNSFNNQETVTNSTPVGGPNSLSNILKGMDTATKEKDKGSQMVTIRRVMDPNNSEPTVTITLKGDQPDKDKVLFKLVNGQAVSGNAGHSGQGSKKGVSRLQSQPQFQSQPHLQPQPQLLQSEPIVPEGLDPEEVKKLKKRQKKERQRLRKQQEHMQEQQKGQLQQLEIQKQQEILRQQQEHIHQQQLALQRQQEELLKQQQQQQNNQSNNSKKNKKKSKGSNNTASPSNNKSSSNKTNNHNTGVSAVVYDGDDMAQSFNLPPGVTINKVEGQPGMVTISNNMGGAFSQPFLPNPNVYPGPVVQGFPVGQETSVPKLYGRASGLSWNSAVDGAGNYPDKDNVIVVDTNNSFLGTSPTPSSNSSKREISSDERVMMAVKGLIDPSTLNMTQKKKFKKKKKELQEEKEREEQKQREEDELMDQMYNIATGKWTKQSDTTQSQTQIIKSQNKKNQKQKENCKQPIIQTNCTKQNAFQHATKSNKGNSQEILPQKQRQHQDITKQISKSNKLSGKDTTLQNITNQPAKSSTTGNQNGKTRQQQVQQQQTQMRQLVQQKQSLQKQLKQPQQQQQQQPKQNQQQQKQIQQQQQKQNLQQQQKQSQQQQKQNQQQQKQNQHQQQLRQNQLQQQQHLKQGQQQQQKQNQQQQKQVQQKQLQQRQPQQKQQHQQQKYQQQNFHQQQQQHQLQGRQMQVTHETQSVTNNHKLSSNGFGGFTSKVGYVPQDIAHEARYAQYLAANASTLARMSYGPCNGNTTEHSHEQYVGGEDDKKLASKKKKTRKGKKGHLEDMTIDSVFTPKDVAEGELDETERDVEAFKRFCYNNVPRHSGEKPKVNFNVKDIMIKKRPCNVNL